MAISVDDTTVTRWTGTPANGVNIDSASFTPANDSLIVLVVSADTGSAANITIAVSGGSLTWTLRVERDSGDAGANSGHVSIWTAPVTTGASMTISVQRSAGVGGTNRISCKAYIVTSQHASPIGAVGEGSSLTNNITPTVFTTTGDGRAFGGATDWNALGLPSSTDVEDAANYAGAISVESVYKSADHASGAGVTLNFDANGIADAVWNWAALEILAAAAAGGVPYQPWPQRGPILAH